MYQPFEYTFWNAHYNVFEVDQVINWFIMLLWLITFTGQIVVANHVWISSKERLATIDKLFHLPFYTSAIVDQSIMLNRRLDEDLFNMIKLGQLGSKQIRREDIQMDADSMGSAVAGIDSRSAAENIRIYACATVWHETADELVQMLKSIIRMDEDQAHRMLAVKWVGANRNQVDYYEFESKYCF